MWKRFTEILGTSSRKRYSSRRSSAPTHQLLESRRLLTTFVVNSLADNAIAVDGQISLREAVLAANFNARIGDAPAGDGNGDIIRFDPSLNGGTINLSQGTISITDDLLIQGGSSGITISTELETGLFQETSSERVAFGGLTFDGGVAESGGAIQSLGGGTTLVVNSTFQNNRALGAGGGAIMHDAGRLNVTNSIFDSNESTMDGGAILSNAGVLGINGGSFTGNSADSGAAVHVKSGTFSSTDVSFSDLNSARIGGAISIGESATAVIRDGNFSQNHATESGGAIWNTSRNNFHILDSVFTGNTSLGTETGTGGGAIFNEDGGVYIRGSQFVSNNAAEAGGAIMSQAGIGFVLNSDFQSNSAGTGGGAIENVDGRFVARDSMFGGTGSDANTANNGGAIRNSGSGTLVINNTEITGNIASQNGGGIWASESGETRLVNFSTLSSNIANGSESGEGGGAIFNDGGDVFITRSQLSGNEALGEFASGGAIRSVDGSTFVIDSSFSGNAASRAGGAVDFSSGYFRATDTSLSGNQAGFIDSSTTFDAYGGAVAVSGAGSRAIFDNATFNGNMATEQGGALWVAEDSTAVLLNNTSFVSNQANSNATSRGGAIFNSGFVRGIEFSMTSNTSESFGGAIYISRTGSASLESGDFNFNTSDDLGGAIFNGNYLSVAESVFLENRADDGGAVYTTLGKALIQSDNQFSNNFPNNFNS